MFKVFVTLFILFLLSFALQGQTPLSKSVDSKDSARYVQVMGVLKGLDSLESIPFATIRINNSSRGTVANYEGYFALVAQAGDTLNISHLAYKDYHYIVPAEAPIFGDLRFHFLQSDTIKQKEIEVYPWPSREEFAKAVLDLKLDYEDAMTRAERMLSGESLGKLSLRVTPDAGIAQNSFAHYNRQQLYRMGQIQTMNVLSPYAWTQFFDALKKGELRRQ
jgi:hypothetical protein